MSKTIGAISEAAMIIAATMMVLIALYAAYIKFVVSSNKSTKDKDVEANDSEDSESTSSHSGSLRSRSKSVRFSDEINDSPLNDGAYVTPQDIPEANISSSQASQERAPKLNNVFRRFARSLTSLMSLTDENTLEEESDDEVELAFDDTVTPSTRSLTPSPSVSIETPSDSMSDEIPPIPGLRSPSETARSRAQSDDDKKMVHIQSFMQSLAVASPRTRSHSVPTQTDDDGFFVGEEVMYQSKKRWKRGVVTSLNPLKVKGADNFRSKKYANVRKLTVLPEIGEEVDDMDVETMTLEDYENLMRSARRDTVKSRAMLSKSMKSHADLVKTITKG